MNEYLADLALAAYLGKEAEFGLNRTNAQAKRQPDLMGLGKQEVRSTVLPNPDFRSKPREVPKATNAPAAQPKQIPGYEPISMQEAAKGGDSVKFDVSTPYRRVTTQTVAAK